MNSQKNEKRMNIGLWIVQVLLSVMFIMAGLTKAFQPIETLAESLPWVSDTSMALVKFIGISELLGGIGLLLPSILKIKPFLTVWAAIGLGTIMVLAAIFHGSRGEFEGVIANIIFLAFICFVAWGRSKKNPIQPKVN